MARLPGDLGRIGPRNGGMEENGGERICDTSKDGGLVSWARLLVGRPLVPLGRWVVGPPDHRRPFFFPTVEPPKKFVKRV